MNTSAHFTRRSFLGAGLTSTLSLPFLHAKKETSSWLEISLQQYSFNGMFKARTLDPLDYPKFAVEKTGIKALEYYNGFFEDKLGDAKYFAEMTKRGLDLGVENQLMLCRSTPALDSADPKERKKAAAVLTRWAEVAKVLGCHSIRVDCRSKGDRGEVKKQAVEGLNQLCDLLKPMAMNAIVENHGNWSSKGDWVKEVMQAVKRDNCGTLPDFGNFNDYDKYQGVKDMLPWAKAVCAKVHKIKANGEAEATDFLKMLQIIKDGGFKGYLGIEFEGHNDPVAGVLGTKKLIQKTLKKLA